MYIKWNSDLSIDHADIDDSHIKLIAFLNATMTDINDSSVVLDNGKIAECCVEHIIEHIEHEDDFMRKLNYPNFDEHFRHHGEIISELAVVLHGLEINDSGVRERLSKWIMTYSEKHINVDDRKLAEFCRSVATQSDIKRILLNLH